jgi:hypothetical protein
MTTDAGRASPFADIDELPAFQPKTPKKPVIREHIDKIAEANNFPSRQPTPATSTDPVPRRAVRRYKTGRDRQINIKATSEVIERLYQLADARDVPLGELLDLALTALEKAGEGPQTRPLDLG